MSLIVAAMGACSAKSVTRPDAAALQQMREVSNNRLWRRFGARCYRCGESRSPVLSPGSKEPKRETGPAAVGHPSQGSSMGFT